MDEVKRLTRLVATASFPYARFGWKPRRARTSSLKYPRRGKRRSEPSDAEVRAILCLRSWCLSGLIYAFQKTGVYVCEENERLLSKCKLAAWRSAVDQYHDAIHSSAAMKARYKSIAGG
jgi:hypothetical protein